MAGWIALTFIENELRYNELRYYEIFDITNIIPPDNMNLGLYITKYI